MSESSDSFEKKASFDDQVDSFLKELKNEITNGIQKVIKYKQPFTELLISASGDGELEIVKYLFEKHRGDFDNDAINDAFYEAAENNRINVVRFLIERGADPNYGNLIEDAIEPEIIRCLLEHGVNITTIEIDDYPDKFSDEVNDFARKLYLTKYAK